MMYRQFAQVNFTDIVIHCEGRKYDIVLENTLKSLADHMFVNDCKNLNRCSLEFIRIPDEQTNTFDDRVFDMFNIDDDNYFNGVISVQVCEKEYFRLYVGQEHRVIVLRTNVGSSWKQLAFIADNFGNIVYDNGIQYNKVTTV